MDKWLEQRIVHSSVLFEDRGEHLVMKLPMSIPYQTSWDEAQTTEGYIIYKDNFFRTYARKFENDTLYTYCVKEKTTQENVIGFLQQVKNHISTEPTSSSKKAMDFFKNLTKDYTRINRSAIALFWVEDLPSKNYIYQEFIPFSFLSFSSPPPDLV